MVNLVEKSGWRQMNNGIWVDFFLTTTVDSLLRKFLFVNYKVLPIPKQIILSKLIAEI